MRKIIILQSLLILAGAYYIYTLQQSSNSVTKPEQTQDQSADDVVETTEADEVAVATTTADVATTSGISGPSDVGMEFPIPDNEADLQVR